MTNPHDDLLGVECGVCHQETFRVLKRTVIIEKEVDCCPHCATKIDATNAEDQAEKSQSKEERRLISQEASAEWANELNGKAVVVYFNINQNLIFADSESDYQVKGTAYRVRYDCKWARIRVYLDESEYSRIVETRTRWSFDPPGGKFSHWSIEAPWGLDIKQDDEGKWYRDLIWGERYAVELIDQGVSCAR